MSGALVRLAHVLLAVAFSSPGWDRWPLVTGTGRPTWLLVSLILLLLPAGFIPAVLVPRRARRQTALAAALGAGRRTPELDAAVRSPIVVRFRMLELAIVATVFGLMVLKPF